MIKIKVIVKRKYIKNDFEYIKNVQYSWMEMDGKEYTLNKMYDSSIEFEMEYDTLKEILNHFYSNSLMKQSEIKYRNYLSENDSIPYSVLENTVTKLKNLDSINHNIELSIQDV